MGIVENEGLVVDYTREVIHQLEKGIGGNRRSYGFEYEFLPADTLGPEDMARIHDLLPEIGYRHTKEGFSSPFGLQVVFEPGGQIEFCSIPMAGWQKELFHSMMETIEKTLSAIESRLNIVYLPVGYLPGRQDAPLCLTSERYVKMHARMPKCGTRGREMMKATASIQLHAGIDAMDKIVPIFAAMRTLAAGDRFGFGPDRKDIWENTDPSRCGDPFEGRIDDLSTRQLIETYVRFALKAEDLGENIPFATVPDSGIARFFEHLTTIFTNTRLNLKGPSIELRTMDSLPLDLFARRWREFIDIMDGI